MTKAQRELIQNASAIDTIKFRLMKIIPYKTYKGFFGKGDYMSLATLVYDEEDKRWVEITTHADKIEIRNTRTIGIDAQTKDKIIRIEFGDYIEVKRELDLSTVWIEDGELK